MVFLYFVLSLEERELDRQQLTTNLDLPLGDAEDTRAAGESGHSNDARYRHKPFDWVRVMLEEGIAIQDIRL